LNQHVDHLEKEIPDSIAIEKLALISLTGTPDNWKVLHSRTLKEVSQV
jgi:hypothetical protein